MNAQLRKKVNTLNRNPSQTGHLFAIEQEDGTFNFDVCFHGQHLANLADLHSTGSN